MKRKRYATKDFVLSSLPQTRWQQFVDVLKNEKLTFLFLSLILLGFSLPLLAVLAVRGEYVASLSSMVQNEEISKDVANHLLLTEDFFFDFLSLLASLIIGVGLAGCCQIFRNLAYEEGILFGGDFREGIRKNIGPVSIIMVLLSFLYVALRTLNDLANVLQNPYFYVGSCMIFGLDVLFIIPLLLIWLGETASYQNRIRSNLQNLFPLLGYGYLGSVMFSSVLGSFYFLTLLGHSVWLYLAFLLLSLLLPYYALGWHLYSLSLFDRTLNRNYPEYRFKGLHRES